MSPDRYQHLFGEPFRITEQTYVASVDEARAKADVPGECSALLWLTFARIHMGTAGPAIVTARAAAELTAVHGTEQQKIESRLWLSMALHFSNDASAPTEFETLPAQLDAVGLHHLSPVARILGLRERTRTVTAPALLEQCTEVAAEAEAGTDPYVKCFVQRVAGMILSGLGERTRAIECLERARDAAQQHELLSQLARTLSAIGAVYAEHSRTREALTELLAAIPLYDKLEIRDWYVAQTNLQIAMLHEADGDSVNAGEYARRAMELFRDAGDTEGAACAEYVLGTSYEKGGHREHAMEAYARAAAAFSATASIHRLSTLPATRRAVIAMRGGDRTAAITELSNALHRAETIGSAIGVVQAHAALGELNAESDQALTHYETAVRVALDNGIDPSSVMEALSHYHEQRGDHTTALRYVREAHTWRERLRDETMQRRLAQLEARRRIEEANAKAQIEYLRNVELKAAQTKLVESEKMASLGQLTAGIAHEINNPVTFIVSSIAPLRRDLEDYEQLGGKGPEADELRAEIWALLDGIENGAKRTAEIVRSLRTFSRMDEGEMKPADLVAGIESTLTILGSRIKGVVEIERHYASIPMVECRPGQLNQVFMNILSNALDALAGVRSPRIRIHVEQPTDAQVQVTIADNGTGIPPSIMNRLFEPFFTTKDVGSGTGLGLSISYGIIEQHRGQIDVSNHDGAVFTITLPVKQPPAQ